MKAMIDRQSIKIFLFNILFLFPAALYAQFPQSFCVFRDTVYAQNASLLETMRLYSAAKTGIENTFTGEERYLLLARCEYLMGLSCRMESKNSEAAAFYEQGIVCAEESLYLRPSSEGYRILATNISLLCEASPSYGLKNINKIEENAEKALALDAQNSLARYIIAAKYVAAPWPFGNVRKGLTILEQLAEQDTGVLEKEDLFNLYLMLEAACLKLKRAGDAQVWHEKASAIYPTNNFIRHLVK